MTWVSAPRDVCLASGIDEWSVPDRGPTDVLEDLGTTGYERLVAAGCIGRRRVAGGNVIDHAEYSVVTSSARPVSVHVDLAVGLEEVEPFGFQRLQIGILDVFKTDVEPIWPTIPLDLASTAK